MKGKNRQTELNKIKKKKKKKKRKKEKDVKQSCQPFSKKVAVNITKTYIIVKRKKKKTFVSETEH